MENDWKVVTNNKKKNQNCGDNVGLPSKYTLWCHEVYNKSWDLSSYKKICTITNVSEFWKLINNLDKTGFTSNNLFLMKDGITPMWEDPNNREGGICSFKVDIRQSLSVFEEFALYMICECLVGNSNDINGLSFSPKNGWAIIKIWNKDKNNDIASLLNNDIKKKYSNLSIKYKCNEPEF
jgi:hypothetical protein